MTAKTGKGRSGTVVGFTCVLVFGAQTAWAYMMGQPIPNELPLDVATALAGGIISAFNWWQDGR